MVKESGGGGRQSGNAGRTVVEKLSISSIKAENAYRGWLGRQHGAVAEINAAIKTARTIKDGKNRVSYLQRAKHDIDTRWIQQYGKTLNG